MKTAILASIISLSSPTLAQLTNPPVVTTATDQAARDAASEALIVANASVKTVGGMNPDGSGNVALPNTFTNATCQTCTMSNAALTGAPTVNGISVASSADIASEAAARNAAISTAINGLGPIVNSVNGMTGVVLVPVYTDAQAIAANASAIASATSKATADILQIVAPASGGTVSIANGTTTLLINNPAILSSLTVALPSQPNDGQRLTIAANGTITTLGFSNGTVRGALTTMSASGYARFVYSASIGAWFRAG